MLSSMWFCVSEPFSLKVVQIHREDTMIQPGPRNLIVVTWVVLAFSPIVRHHTSRMKRDSFYNIEKFRCQTRFRQLVGENGFNGSAITALCSTSSHTKLAIATFSALLSIYVSEISDVLGQEWLIALVLHFPLGKKFVRILDGLCWVCIWDDCPVLGSLYFPSMADLIYIWRIAFRN